MDYEKVLPTSNVIINFTIISLNAEINDNNLLLCDHCIAFIEIKCKKTESTKNEQI